MFNQTHPPFFPSPSKLSSSSHSSQVEKGMESTVKDVSSSSTSVVVGEVDLFVDQLLNLNNDEQQDEETQQQQQVSETQPFKQQQLHKDCVFIADNDVPFLNIPAEEADLEWLSQFVEETESSPFSTPFPPNYVRPEHEPLPEPNYNPSQPLALSRSRRRKRARIGDPEWATSFSEAETWASPNRWVPKQKLNPKPDPGSEKKKCSHCGAVKTPQWRTGPRGSNTLCNACGVRYKSGRLYPEYRPAGSPWFSSELHSNSHRKVLEMREKKMGGPTVRGPGSELRRSLSSFG